MSTLLILPVVVAVALTVAGVVLKGRLPATAENLTYEARKEFLTPAERSFFGVLAQAVEGEYLIFGKVRLADLIQPVKGLSNSRRTTALNCISKKHVDFVLCRPDTLAVAGVIELDDASHKRQARTERDDLVDRAFASAGIVMIRFPARKAYAVQEVRGRLTESLTLKGEGAAAAKVQEPAPVATETVKAVEPRPTATSVVEQVTSPAKVEKVPEGAASTSVQDAAGPVCPACSSQMVRRQAKKGPHAGKWFWACAEFPRCRRVVEVGN